LLSMLSIAYFFYFWPFSVKLGICFSHPKFTLSFWVELQMFIVFEMTGLCRSLRAFLLDDRSVPVIERNSLNDW
jgi:hypothetical protein